MGKWLLLLVLSISASASVTINATFVGPNQAAAPFAYLTLDLMDCGYNVPSVPGAPASMVLKHVQLTPAQLPATIYGNNEITCGNSYSTLWHVTAWANSTTKLAGDYNYDLCSSTSNCLSVVTATWDLSSAQPFVGSPPPPGFKAIFGNPVQSQTLKQPANTSLAIYGVLDLTNATVLGLGNVGINAQTIQGNAICTTAPADTFVLTWSAASNWWCPSAGGGVSANATQIQGRNVLSTLPTSSQFLGFDGANWLPKTISGFLPLAGGTLTGALTLPGNVTGALQATPLQQIQSLLTAKADIVSGFVPTSELGSGGGGLGNKCLVDNNTWSAACGGGGGGGVSFPIFSTTQGSLTTPAYSFTATPDLGLAATVSTSAKYTVLSSTRAGGTVTSTLLSAVTFLAGQSIQVTGQTDVSYNCANCQLTSVSNGGLTIQYPAAGNDGSSTGGSVSPWENVLTGYMVRFNRMESSSANAAKIGSIRGGPTDPWYSGCPSCSPSAITGTTDQNVIRPQAANGPVLVGDYQGIQASGPIMGQGPLYVQTTIPVVAPVVGPVSTSGLAANTTGSICMWVKGGVCHDLANVDNTTTTQQFVGVPTGTCSAGMIGVNSTNGDMYVCINSVWVKTGLSNLGPNANGPNFIGYTVGKPWVAPSGTNGVAPYCSGTSNVNVGGSGGVVEYCTVMAFAADFDYIQMPLRWIIGANSDGGVDTGFESISVPSSNPPPSTQYNFTNLDTRVFTPLSTFTCGANLGRPHPCWFALQLGPTQASSYLAPQVPDYVYQFGANTWPDMAAYTWTAGTPYYQGQTVKFGGQYYQLTSTISCTPTGNTGPSADGCTWSAPAAHAPPLDVANTAGQPGAANTLPGTCNNACASAGVYGVFNLNSSTCGPNGITSCATNLWLQQATEAIWENPVLVAEVNAANYIASQIAGKPYAANWKYFRPGLFTDGTSFNNAETALKTLVGNSTTNIEGVIAGIYGIKLLQPITAKTHAAGALVDCNFANNSTPGDTSLTTACTTYSDMMGILGLQNSDITAYYANTRSTNNWEASFSANAGVAGNIKAFHMQSISQSDTTKCNPLTTGGGAFCMPTAIPFATQFRGNLPLYLELYAGDMRCAFDSTWNGTGCNGSSPNLNWQAAIFSAALGAPTPNVSGPITACLGSVTQYIGPDGLCHAAAGTNAIVNNGVNAGTSAMTLDMTLSSTVPAITVPGIALAGASGAATTISTTTTNASLILAPNGTGPLVVNVGTATNPSTQAAGSASNTGLNYTASSVCWDTTGTFNICLSGTGLEIGGNKPLFWGSASGASSGQGVGLLPLVAAGVTQNAVTLDTTSTGNELGLLRAGNACKIAADVTLPVNTATTVCSWTLPAVAKVWGWQCQLPWVISAGTGTNTISIGVNASQTPAATTNASAEIKTTNTNTATENTVALSASGAVNVLTSPTITPAATLLLSSTSGTLSAPATAGTFAITMTAAGTTATAAAKAGATCWLY